MSRGPRCWCEVKWGPGSCECGTVRRGYKKRKAPKKQDAQSPPPEPPAAGGGE